MMAETTRDAVPVSELVELRNWLHKNGQITLCGLGRLNRLISKCGGYDNGKTE